MNMTLLQLYNEITKARVPETDLRERVMAKINTEKHSGFPGRRYFKLVFVSLSFVFVFFQGLTLLNDIILNFVNNADEGNRLYQMITAIKLDRLAAIIKDFDIGIFMRDVVNFFTDIFSSLFNFPK